MKREEIETIEDAAIWFMQEYPELFTEAYSMGNVIEVLCPNRQFRIEPIKSLSDSNFGRYSVRVYEKEDSKLKIWDDFPSCDRDSAHEVMVEALGFLWDRLRPKG
jgi:hypothetical protein